MKKFLIINFVAMLFACNISMKAVEAEAENIEPNASKENKTSYPSAQARATFGQKPQNISKPLSSPVEKPTTANAVNKPANEGGIAIPKSAVSKEPVQVTNADQPEQEDPLKIEKIKNDDGTITKKATYANGDTLEVTKMSDGSSLKLLIKADQSRETTTTNVDDGTTTVEKTSSDGIRKEEVTTNKSGDVIHSKKTTSKSITETTISGVKPNQTTIVKTENLEDLSVMENTTYSDGTKIKSKTNQDGSSRTLVTSPDGSKIDTIIDADGSAHVTTTDVNGQKSEPTFHYAGKATDKDIAKIDPATYDPTATDLDNIEKEILTPSSVLAAKRILGIQIKDNNDLTVADVNTAYRSLSKQTHSDKQVGKTSQSSQYDQSTVNAAKNLLLRRFSA